MNAPRPSFASCIVRASSPALLSACAAVVLIAHTLFSLVDLERDAQQVDFAIAQARVAIAADTMLAEQADAARRRQRVSGEVAGLEVELCHGGDGFSIVATGRGGDAALVRHLVARDLPGGASRAFARSRMVCAGGDDSAWPRWDERALRDAPRVRESLGFCRDRGIALRHLAAGTDREDYCWTRSESGLGGLLVVPGNLWVPFDRGPLELELTKDLVLVVAGNLYLQRDLVVRGGGRLLLATRCLPGDLVFADRDGDGVCASVEERLGGDGELPIEGAGGAWFGLGGRGGTLRCDAGLLVSGQLHLSTRADIRGPLLLRHGVTTFADGELLPVAPTAWTFPCGRACIPGFVVRGGRRPGPPEFLAR